MSEDIIEEPRYIVRLYDGFDNQWIDITGPLSHAEALEVWNKRTDGGTKKTKYSDIDYYRIFPSATQMLFSGGFGER